MADNIEYKILKDDGPNELEYQVNQMIAKGWEPFGGVQVAVEPVDGPFSANKTFYQTMVRVTFTWDEEDVPDMP